MLQTLPASWYAYTNLDLATSPGSSREIDVIIVAEDRILVVDLKDWKGPIESKDGRWFNAKRDHGPSPVKKINENAREIYIQLKTHLARHAKNKIVPKVQGLVVLTKSKDLDGIAESEVSNVMSIEAFLAALKSTKQRIKTFGAAPPQGSLVEDEWKNQLAMFFNVSKGVFVSGRRMYGGFYAESGKAVFEHPEGMYKEFLANDERSSPTLGILRLWDFTRADTRFQTADGRAEIAGREQEVIAYLKDRSDRCDSVIVDGKTRDPNFSPSYWEVFDRKRRLHRLMDFAGTELADLKREERIELARQVLTSLDALHLAEAAHLDLGQHSIWLQRPSTVRFSHFMAASYPEIKTLGNTRYQFLVTGKLPEDEFDEKGTAKQRDVFLAACAIHRILFDCLPPSPTGCSEWDSSIKNGGDFLELHGWFETALSWEPGRRFDSAGDALTAFNAATAVRPSPAEVIAGLERYRSVINSQFQLYANYPPSIVLRDDEERMLWRSEHSGREVLVKMWKRASWGDQTREGARILDFLDRLSELAISEPNGCAKILEVIWLGDAIVMVQEWIDRPDLARVINDGDLDDDGKIQLVGSLAELIAELHTQHLAHGDLKPENVLVDPAKLSHPIVVDLVDFVASDDGESMTNFYSPEFGDSYQRDCYALTVIAENLIGDLDSLVADRIRVAVSDIRSGNPPNSTVLPLIDAVKFEESVAPSRTALILFSPREDAGPFLPDEGKFYLRQLKGRRALIIRGACEELTVYLDPDGKAVGLSRRPIDQSRIAAVSRHEFGEFHASITIEHAPVVDLSALGFLLVRDDVVNIVAACDSRGDENLDEGDDKSAEREEPSSEPPEDDLIESIAAGPTPTGDVQVARLWSALVTAEREMITYGHAASESTYDRSLARHRVDFDLISGSLDYNRRDRVMVERAGRNDEWRPLAVLDVAGSKPDLLLLDSLWPDQKTGYPLIQQGDELRFRSRMEETSLDRRQNAIQRIVSRNSRIRNLIDVVDTRSRFDPIVSTDLIPPEELRDEYGLNQLQAETLSKVLATRPLTLIQGPPGTGKTTFIAALVHAAITRGFARNVLLASQAHEAVNNAAEAVLKRFAKAGEVPSIIRVGAEGVVSDPLLPYHVERVEQLHKDRFRAEFRERLSIAAKGLGIEGRLGEDLAFVELAIRPVAEKLAAVADEEDSVQRANSLRNTIRLQAAALHAAEVVEYEASPESVVERVVDKLLSTLPNDKRPSPDRIARFQSVAQLARDFIGSVSTSERSFETFLAGTRQIVAGTCVGLGRSSLGLTSTSFDLVIVDEAARCTASELAVPIQSGSNVVLVGDQKQLEPQHPEGVVSDVAALIGTGVAEVARSDFERVFDSRYGALAGHTLTMQYRMLEPIGEIVSHSFYNGALSHGRTQSVVSTNCMPIELKTPVSWVDTTPLGIRAEQGNRNIRKSVPNAAEADAIVALLKNWSSDEKFLSWLDEYTGHAHAIGIICAYSAQRDLVRQKLMLAQVSPKILDAVKVDTIDSYQGKENPIVIVSLVRNNREGKMSGGEFTIRPGFLAKPNRINVAISRAMDRLVIVGSLGRWEKEGPMSKIVSAFGAALKNGDAAVIDVNTLLDIPSSERKELGSLGAEGQS